MKNSKENVIAQVQSSVSSIFSKEDVINLLNSVQDSSRTITTSDIQRAVDKTISWFENNERDVLDLSNAEFEISYDNRLECVGVPINFDEIREALENNFMDFGEAEQEVEEDEIELEEIKRIEEDNN